MAGRATVAAAVLGALLSGCGTVAYLRDVLRGRTVPHRGSWLVWSVIAVVALVAHGADGGRWSVLVLGGQAAGTLAVLALAVPRGTGGVTVGNTVLVGLAGLGVAGWLTFDRPVAAAGCAALADGAGLLALAPKIWADPHSETTATYGLAGVTGMLAVVSLPSVEASLLVYPGYFCLANALTAHLISRRRRSLARPCDVRPGRVGDCDGDHHDEPGHRRDPRGVRGAHRGRGGREAAAGGRDLPPLPDDDLRGAGRLVAPGR